MAEYLSRTNAKDTVETGLPHLSLRGLRTKVVEVYKETRQAASLLRFFR